MTKLDTRTADPHGVKLRVSKAVDAKVKRLSRPRESANLALGRLLDELQELRREKRTPRNGKEEA